MKIEMGESLFYSWLRHVKDCQIVQTNWKVAAEWPLYHPEEVQQLFELCRQHFLEKYGYTIFKQNTSLSQILQQGECDALGISLEQDAESFYAVDVAFHGAGLNYGSKDETIMKVIAKSIRTAMCLYGYLDTQDADIIFASPKINNAVLNELLPCIADVNQLFAGFGLAFRVRLIANDDFNTSILQPILLVSNGIADTSELFIRSYQLFTMFGTPDTPKSKRTANPRVSTASDTASTSVAIENVNMDAYAELKIGKLANVILRRLLEDGAATKEEIEFLQTPIYSKQFFDLQFPVLLKTTASRKEERYYKDLLTIDGETYRLCSEWYEVPANNDRPYLLKWIEKHSK
ncbi:MAG: hypothetical protein R3Y06_03195 [Faecalibacterium sp.]